MHYMIIAIMMAVIAVIGMMLQRVFQGPTVYDRMNGLGVTGTDTILLIILFGYLDGRPEMYVLFIGFSYRDAEAARFLLPAACFRQQ